MTTNHEILDNDSSRTVLGIEGGGTHTVALWADETGGLLRKMEFGCGNVRLLDDHSLLQLFREIQNAGSDLPPSQSICAAMAGAVNDADKKRVLNLAQSIFGTAFSGVYSDLQSPLFAAELPADYFPVLVLCGTGSCCYAENPSRNLSYKSGGWGHLLGDRGSGYQIGLQALRSCLTLWDQTQQFPTLGKNILSFQLLNSPADWIQWSLQASKREIAQLAQVVCQSAECGCPVSERILREAAGNLASDALVCASQVSASGITPFFILSGGLLKKSTLYREWVSENIRKKHPHSPVELLQVESAWGVVKKALQSLPQGSFASLTKATKKPEAIPASPAASSLTEQRNPRSMHLDELEIEDAIQLMIDEEQYTQQAIQTQKPLIAELIRKVSGAFQKEGRLFYVGAGTSGRLGVLDASECPPTFGVSYDLVQGIIAGGQEALWRAAEGAEDSFHAGSQTAFFRGIRPGDVVIGIAASGTTPFVLGFLAESKKIGAFTALLCFNPNRHPDPNPQNEPDIILALPIGPEILTGSTRLKAGTATKLVLNMITTLSMVQSGRVISNLMVDVQPTNEKLRDRAIRILSQLTGWPRERSQEALEQSQWNIRNAMNRKES
ncbi:MAG: N-acetylmuramic acid 6-phosphate etherase [Limisphaerales bacterium]|nr:N-acetylmuramic acid 6-phosphate etherase [Verrucomicrobiota bacterium]